VVQNACDGLGRLLRDVDQRVRVAGSHAVTQVLFTYWGVLPTAQIWSLLNCKENDRSAFSSIYETSPSPPSRKRSRYRTCLARNLVYSLCRCSKCRWQFVTSTIVSCAVPCALLPIFATDRLSSLQGRQRHTVAQRRRFVASPLRPHSLAILRRHKCASPSSSGTGLALGL
jgi:hypothetical protein